MLLCTTFLVCLRAVASASVWTTAHLICDLYVQELGLGLVTAYARQPRAWPCPWGRARRRAGQRARSWIAEQPREENFLYGLYVVVQIIDNYGRMKVTMSEKRYSRTVNESHKFSYHPSEQCPDVMPLMDARHCVGCTQTGHMACGLCHSQLELPNLNTHLYHLVILAA